MDYQAWKAECKALIDALPEGDVVIVGLTYDYGRFLKRRVAERRGGHLARKCRVVSALSRDFEAALTGLRAWVLIDPAVRECLSVERRRLIERVAREVSAGISPNSATAV